MLLSGLHESPHLQNQMALGALQGVPNSSLGPLAETMKKQGTFSQPQSNCRSLSDTSRSSVRRLNNTAARSAALDLAPIVTVSTTERSGNPDENLTSTSGRTTAEGSYIEFPAWRSAEQNPKQQPPLVRVRLSVHYRVHSRQMLCIGGSQIPFGWSFLSIAKVPMEWNPGDVWTAEVELPANSRIEYKYVILEEQDWTQQVSEDAEGVVTFTYRTQREGPPDVQQIQKQMAIVAWQPGPNRYVQVPSQEELDSLQPGEVRKREPARGPSQKSTTSRTYGQQALGGLPNSLAESGLPLLARVASSMRNQRGENSQSSLSSESDELAGTWENLLLDGEGQPLLERRDVWGFPRENRGIEYGEKRDPS